MADSIPCVCVPFGKSQVTSGLAPVLSEQMGVHICYWLQQGDGGDATEESAWWGKKGERELEKEKIKEGLKKNLEWPLPRKQYHWQSLNMTKQQSRDKWLLKIISNCNTQLRYLLRECGEGSSAKCLCGLLPKTIIPENKKLFSVPMSFHTRYKLEKPENTEKCFQSLPITSFVLYRENKTKKDLFLSFTCYLKIANPFRYFSTFYLKNVWYFWLSVYYLLMVYESVWIFHLFIGTFKHN